MAPPARLKPAVTATVELEITPPGPPGTRPWWTVLWNGTSATVRTAAGLDGEHPADWGIACTSPDHTDAWRAEGGTPYVIEQILDGFAGAGASARIVDVRGSAEARRQMLTALRVFADAHPACDAELRRFALKTGQDQKGENR